MNLEDAARPQREVVKLYHTQKDGKLKDEDEICVKLSNCKKQDNSIVGNDAVFAGLGVNSKEYPKVSYYISRSVAKSFRNSLGNRYSPAHLLLVTLVNGRRRILVHTR